LEDRCYADPYVHGAIRLFLVLELMLMLSLKGWAAGDVSLAAYIQASLAGNDHGHPGISALGAVMAFLYSSYIVMYAVLGVLLGRVFDNDFTAHKNIISSLRRNARYVHRSNNRC
jgi:hypothetical protein